MGKLDARTNLDTLRMLRILWEIFSNLGLDHSDGSVAVALMRISEKLIKLLNKLSYN